MRRFSTIMPRSWWLVLFFGVILRLLLSAFTFHPDFRPFQFTGQMLAEGHILDLYDVLNSIQDPKIHQIVLLNYPPAIYWFFGVFNFLIGSVLHIGLLNQFLIERPQDFGNLWFSLHLLLIKLPYLVWDIPAAFLLAKLFTDPRQKFWAFCLWIFNPINLMATYMMGQFDVIAVMTTIWCLVLVKNRRVWAAALILGVGIAFKIYPLYLLIPLMLVEKRWWYRLAIGILGLLPYIISVAPYLTSKGYRTTALLAGQSLKSFYAQLPLSGGESIIWFVASLALVYLYIYYHQTRENLWKSFLVVMLVFFIFTHTHPQWLLWLTPFLIIELVMSRFKTGILMAGILLSWLALLFSFDQSLSLGFFAPIWPSLYTGPSLWQVLNITIDNTFYRSVWQSLFVSCAVYLIYLYLPRKSDDS